RHRVTEIEIVAGVRRACVQRHAVLSPTSLGSERRAASCCPASGPKRKFSCALSQVDSGLIRCRRAGVTSPSQYFLQNGDWLLPWLMLKSSEAAALKQAHGDRLLKTSKSKLH